MTDLETALLSACLHRPEEIAEAASIVSRRHMTRQAGVIFGAMLELLSEGSPIDLLPLIEKLKQNGNLAAAGGAAAISRLYETIPAVGMAAYTAKKLKSQYLARKAIADLESAQKRISDGAAPDEAITEVLRAVLAEKAEAGANDAAEVAQQVIDDVTSDVGERQVVRVSLLDPPLLPLSTGGMYVVAGATASGKTALADQITVLAAEGGWKSVIIGLEMTSWERAARLLAHIGKVSISAILTRYIPDGVAPKLEAARDHLKALPLRLVDGAGMTLDQLAATIYREALGGAKLFVVDYIQLVRHAMRGRSREQEVAEVSKMLASLAAKQDLCIIAVAQLSREHLRQNRPPDLHDLRESGQIEQDARAVVMLAQVPGQDDARLVYIRKQRFGQTGRVGLHFNGATLTFSRPREI